MSSLSALDFLGLANSRRVVPVELSEVGHVGVVFIREMSEGEKEKATGNMKGKIKYAKDGSTEMDFSSLPRGASLKLLKASLVTDETGKVLMADEWEKELKFGSEVLAQLEAIPAVVVNLLVGKIRTLNGMGDAPADPVEKKEES